MLVSNKTVDTIFQMEQEELNNLVRNILEVEGVDLEEKDDDERGNKRERHLAYYLNYRTLIND